MIVQHGSSTWDCSGYIGSHKTRSGSGDATCSTTPRFYIAPFSNFSESSTSRSALATSTTSKHRLLAQQDFRDTSLRFTTCHQVMTTSNPVVPQLTTVAPGRERHRETEVFGHWQPTTLNLWPMSDFSTIAWTLTCFRYLFSARWPDNLHLFGMHGIALSLLVTSAGVIVFWNRGVYSPVFSPLNINETEQLLRSISYITLVTALFVSYIDLRLEMPVFMSSCIVALLLTMQRGLARRLMSSSRTQMLALIYARQLDLELLNAVHTASGNTLEFAGLLCDDPGDRAASKDAPYEFFGTWSDVQKVSEHTGASHILLVGFDNISREADHFVQECERLRLQCSILLDPRQVSNAHPEYTFMDELPVLRRPTVAARTQLINLKRTLDLVISTCLLILILPFVLLLAAIVKYDSRGPVFFRQKRIGKDGRPFELFKFRTMYIGSPKYHRSPTSDCDPRITRFGRVLRRFSLDELPQLLNVLKGDMSLVGPRPEMPFIVDQYNDAARGRLAVRPGITGLWQISRARSLPIHHNLQYDLFYIDRHNIFLDAAILLRTFAAVVRGVGAA